LKSHDKFVVLAVASSDAISSNQNLEMNGMTFKSKKKDINSHWHSIYEKFVIAYACIFMFFIGAPLGAIIRKGGLGLPIVFANSMQCRTWAWFMLTMCVKHRFTASLHRTMRPSIPRWISGSSIANLHSCVKCSNAVAEPSAAAMSPTILASDKAMAITIHPGTKNAPFGAFEFRWMEDYMFE